MNLSPLGRDGREAPVRVLQLGIDMSKTACIQTATQCPLLSFDSLLRSTPLPSLPRCARASLEARPRSLCELRYGPKGERGGTRIGKHCLQRPAQIVSPRVLLAPICRGRFVRLWIAGRGSFAGCVTVERERDGTPLGVTSMVLTAACVTTDTGRGEDSPARAAHGFDAVGMGGALCCRRR
jgi:hypothetical protein